MPLRLPQDIGSGRYARQKVIKQVRSWIQEKQQLSDIILALLQEGYNRKKIGEYLEIAEMNGESEA
jgi:hypothetical protein